MTSQNQHFLEFDFPSAGTFYEDAKCENPLFFGQLEINDGKFIVKVLEHKKDISLYGGIIYAHLRSKNDIHNIISWSFFDCNFNENTILFKSFAIHNNHNYQGLIDLGLELRSKKISIPDFITKDNTFKKISIKIENLDEWLWQQPANKTIKEKLDYRTKCLDVYGNDCNLYDTAEIPWSFNEKITNFSIPAHTIHKTININSDTKIEIHSTPWVFGEYPDIKIGQSCHIDIICKEPKSIDFFYWFVYNLTLYFSSIGVRKCKIYRIYNFEARGIHIDFYNNQIPWYLEKKDSDYWFTSNNMLYHNIEEDLENSIQLFFNKQNTLRNIIQFIVDIDNIYENEYLETYISQQIQLMETYGNLKLMGNYKINEKEKICPSENLQDLKKVISLLNDETFDKIFVHNYPNNNSRGREIFGWDHDQTKSIEELKKLLLNMLIEIRNYLTHPYKNGCQKELKNTKLPKYYYLDDRLNMSAVGALSNSFKMMLHWFLYEEIGLEKYYNK